MAELIAAFDSSMGAGWHRFASDIQDSDVGCEKLLSYLLRGEASDFYSTLAERCIETNPHAIYPTSSDRKSCGCVKSTADNHIIEAVVSLSTSTSIRLIDHALEPNQHVLRDIYICQGRCVCWVDHSVEQFYGDQIERYFAYHNILLEKLVFRAMEVDKGIHTVEKMLGEFKRLGVSRNEPVLIVGGGVLSDTGGLACALYHRNTPYVMLSTSILVHCSGHRRRPLSAHSL